MNTKQDKPKPIWELLFQDFRDVNVNTDKDAMFWNKMKIYFKGCYEAGNTAGRKAEATAFLAVAEGYCKTACPYAGNDCPCGLLGKLREHTGNQLTKVLQ